MKKILLLLLAVSYSLSSLFAAAVVNDFFGKVKVKLPGESSWSKIEIGMELPDSAVVSTGFNSQIVLDLGNATLDVMPLTRMTINEITESQDTISTSLFLQGGSIKADVKKVEGKVNDFKIKSPVATASVRGTAFSFSGNRLVVERGIVAFGRTKEDKGSDTPTQDSEGDQDEEQPEDSGGVAVKAGGQTEMASPNGTPEKPQAMAKKSRSTSASTKPTVVKSGPSNPEPAALTPASVQSAVEAATTRVTIKVTLND